MNESKINLEDTNLPVPKWHQKILFLIAGSDVELLQQCPKTDWIAHMTCGITILLTGMLAAVSAAYAVSLAFDSWFIALLFGLFWGFMIMTYDKSIIISLGRAKLVKDPDADKRNAIKIAVRIALAVLFSIMVSKPLEVKLVSKRIHEDMAKKNDTSSTVSLTRQLDFTDKVNARKKKVLDEIRNDSLAILRRDNKYAVAQRSINTNLGQIKLDSTQIGTLDGQSRTVLITSDQGKANADQRQSLSRHIGYLKIANQKYANKIGEVVRTHLADFKTNNNNHKAELARAQKDVDNFNQAADQKQAALTAAQNGSTDILSNVQVLGKIADDDPTVRWFTYFFTLIIVCIELGPIILKLISDAGPYDYLKESRNHQYYTEEQYKVDALDSELSALREKLPEFASFRVETEISTETVRAEKQLTVNTNLLELIVERQEELAEKYIEAWYQEELNKVNEQTEKNKQQADQSPNKETTT